jgi:hypothetical protein
MKWFGIRALVAVLMVGLSSLILPESGHARGEQAAASSADPNPLTVVQQLALAREMGAIPSAVTARQAAAATALVQASLTLPVNEADIRAKAKALADADLALANEKAAAFQRVQQSLQPLNAGQIAAYASGVGNAGGGRGASATWETAYDSHAGFVPLFDGKTLDGWESEGGKWDVQDGSIHRHQMLQPKNFVDFGQLHIFYKEVFTDFDLKVEFKLRSGNGGIQYRSRLESALRAQPGEPARTEISNSGGVTIPLRNVAAAIADPLGKPLPSNIKTLDDALAAHLLPSGPPYGNGTGHPWQVSGYQFDILDNYTGATGGFYEGQGRGTLANPGEVIQLSRDPATGASVRTLLGRASDVTAPQYYKKGEWNQAEIIARGNTLVHMLNGKVFCVVIDDDASRRALKGIISLQLEGPADNEVWYRNVWLKKLSPIGQ